MAKVAPGKIDFEEFKKIVDVKDSPIQKTINDITNSISKVVEQIRKKIDEEKKKVKKEEGEKKKEEKNDGNGNGNGAEGEEKKKGETNDGSGLGLGNDNGNDNGNGNGAEEEKEGREEKVEISVANDNLLSSAKDGNLKDVKTAIDNGADINYKSDVGDTALMLASEKGHKDIVEFLLKQDGIDINAKSNSEMTALMYASSDDYKDIVKLLIDAGANKNPKNGTGKSALNHATSNEVKNMLRVNLVPYNVSKYAIGGGNSGRKRVKISTQIAGFKKSLKNIKTKGGALKLAKDLVGFGYKNSEDPTVNKQISAMVKEASKLVQKFQ